MDNTSKTGLATSAIFHGALLFIPGFGFSIGEKETFFLHEVTLVPMQTLATKSGSGMSGLSRPGPDEAAKARVALRRELEAQQKKLEAKMNAIQRGARKDIREGSESRAELTEGLKTESGADPLEVSRDAKPGSPGDIPSSDKPAVSGQGTEKGGASLSGGIRARGLRASVTPPYPAWAREQGLEGEVLLEITVLESGLVEPSAIRLVQTSGFRDMDLAVIQALSDWEFEPVPEGTGPQTGRIRFRFRLVGKK